MNAVIDKALSGNDLECHYRFLDIIMRIRPIFLYDVIYFALYQYYLNTVCAFLGMPVRYSLRSLA